MYPTYPDFSCYMCSLDFYDDTKHDIIEYSPLKQRIGQPNDKSPKALQKVWNLNTIEFLLEDY